MAFGGLTRALKKDLVSALKARSRSCILNSPIPSNHIYISSVRVSGLAYPVISRPSKNVASDNVAFKRCLVILTLLLFNTTESLGLVVLIHLISRQGILDTPFLAPQRCPPILEPATLFRHRP